VKRVTLYLILCT